MHTQLLVIATLVVGASQASGQSYSTGFEPPHPASPNGAVLLDGWYVPSVGGVPYSVYTYAGNTLGFNSPPNGQAQFAAAQAVVGNPARAQRDCQFTPGTWVAAWDMSARYNGTLPSAPNLGSFSLQPYAINASWQTLHNWFNVANAATWRCAFLPYDAAGIEAPPPGVLPSPAWDNLQPGGWYRVRVTWSFTTNQIISVAITNLATGVTTTDSPTGWFLAGGASGTLPMATAYRLFTGGAAGNAMAWDNLSVAPACYPDCNGDGALNLADFGCFQTRFALGDLYADCNTDQVLNLADFGCFQTAFAVGCP